MLKSLRIRNYRVFKDLKVDGLHRINLIAGKNNSGKTSFLEAIFLLCGCGDPSLAMNTNILRGQDMGPAGATLTTFMTDWKSIFHNLCLDQAVEIKGSHSVQGSMKIRVEGRRTSASQLLPGSVDNASITDTPAIGSLSFSYSSSVDDKTETCIRVTRDGVQIEEPKTIPSFATKILLPGSTNTVDDASLLGKLRVQKRDDVLVEALRVIEPKLQSVIDSFASGMPIIWGDVGLSEMVPLYTMGEGTTRLARIVLGISSVPGGIVLVDEVENGIHHSVQAKVWKAIACAAEQFDTQVFATTHSFEFIETAARGIGLDGFKLFRLDKTEAGKNKAVVYRPDMVEMAIRRNMEVR